MASQKIITRNHILVVLIIAATAMRFISFKNPGVLSNFTPVGAIAVFGGVYFADKWKAYVVVLLSIILSDIIINQSYSPEFVTSYRDTFWYCVCFSVIIYIGSLIKKINIGTSLIIIFAPVLVHWLIMDMPWINDAQGLYPKTLAGYGAALIAAIPFEKNILLGDIVFGFILFGGFELAKTKFAILRPSKKLAL